MGTICDEDGHPVEGASVKAYVPLREARSDATGRYRMTGSAPGLDSIQLTRSGYVDQRAAVRFVADREVSANFVLRPATRLVARVIHPDGTPPADLEVGVRGSNTWREWVDVDGRFEAVGSFHGPVAVTIEIGGLQKTRFVVPSVNEWPAEFIVPRGGYLEASIDDPDDGEPREWTLHYEYLEPDSLRGHSSSRECQDNPEIIGPLSPGRVEVWVGSTPSGRTHRRTVDIVASQTTRVALEREALRGTAEFVLEVREAGGAPISGAEVSSNWHRRGFFCEEAATPGRYRLLFGPGASRTFMVWAEGTLGREVRRPTLGEDPAIPRLISVTLEQGARLEVAVDGEGDLEAIDVAVVYHDKLRLKRYLADPDLEQVEPRLFRGELLPAGLASVELLRGRPVRRSLVLDRREVVLRVGSTTRVSLQLGDRVRVEGVVTLDGIPVESGGIWVRIGNTNDRTTIDRDGRYVFESLPAGRGLAKLYQDTRRYRTPIDVSQESHGGHLAVAFHSDTLNLRFVDRAGDPVPHAHGRLFPNGAWFTADSDGRATLKNMSADEHYTFLLDAPDRFYPRGSFHAPPGTETISITVESRRQLTLRPWQAVDSWTVYLDGEELQRATEYGVLHTTIPQVGCWLRAVGNRADDLLAAAIEIEPGSQNLDISFGWYSGGLLTIVCAAELLAEDLVITPSRGNAFHQLLRAGPISLVLPAGRYGLVLHTEGRQLQKTIDLAPGERRVVHFP